MDKTIGQTTAWLRHVATAAGSIIAIVGVLAKLSPDEQTSILAAINQFVDGATGLLVGLGTIVGVGSALWARWTAKPAQQVAAVQALPNVETIVAADPNKPLTAGAPGAKVMSHWLVAMLAAALCAPILAGCGDTATLKTANDAVQIAIGVKQGGEAALAGYQQIPVCGTTGSGPLCQDLNVTAFAQKALVTLGDAIDDAQRAITAMQTGGATSANIAGLTAVLVKATFDVNAAVARFKSQ